MHISFNLLLGAFAIAYGVYCYLQWKISPEKIDKLQTLIERNDEKMGNAIYLFGHAILPVVAGLLLLLAYFRS